MKIILVGNLPVNVNQITGGVESVILNLLEGFSISQLCELYVDVVSFNPDIKACFEHKLSDAIKIHYFPFGEIKSTKWEMLFHGRKELHSLIKKIQPDFIHFQGNGSDLLLSIGLDRGKVIITPHAILREELKYQASIKKKINHLVVCFIERLLLPKCNRFIFISNYTRDYFFTKYKKLNTQGTKFSVICNPIASIFFTENEPDFKLLKMVFVGALIPRKGLHVLIEALNIIKNENRNFHLDIVGDFLDDNYREKTKALIKSYGMSDFITFHGWKSQGDVRTILTSANCFVLPSFQETLPVSIAEALATGKIVISSRVGAVSEMLENNVNGFLFDKGDIGGLVSVFQKLEELDLPSISRNAKVSAQKYHPRDVADQTYLFYQEALK